MICLNAQNLKMPCINSKHMHLHENMQVCLDNKTKRIIYETDKIKQQMRQQITNSNIYRNKSRFSYTKIK